MRAVIQRVTSAEVQVGGEVTASIGDGLLILLGVGDGDTVADAEWLAAKIAKMRIFKKGQRGMDASLIEVGGAAIVVSQFTLFASTKKGNRPGFTAAASPEIAEVLYRDFARLLGEMIGQEVGTGIFGADMAVSLQNDGPVTIIIDSRDRS